jgi:hypothetical protein
MKRRIKPQSKATMSNNPIRTVDQATCVYLEAGQDGYPMLSEILEEIEPSQKNKEKRIRRVKK